MARNLDLINELRQYFTDKDLSGLTNAELKDLSDKIKSYTSSDFLNEARSQVDEDTANKIAQSFGDAFKQANYSPPGGFDAILNFSRNLVKNKTKIDGATDSEFSKLYNSAFPGGSLGGGPAKSAILNKIDALGLPRDIAQQEYPDLGIEAQNTQLQTFLDKQNKDQQVNDFLTQLPEDLKGSREDYLNQLTDLYGQQYREQIAPQVAANTNARGLLFSGELPDALSQAAVNVQGNLDAARTELEQQDFDLYFNAAYQKKVQDLLASTTGYESALANERSNILANQERRFTATQNDLNSKTQQELLQKALDRQEATQQASLRKQLQQNQSNNTATGLGIVGTVAGGVAGSYTGNSAIGAQVGNTVGTSVGRSIG